MMIPTDTVEKVVRRPVSRAEAERLVGVLRQQSGASDDRPWAMRFHDNMVTLIKRPLEAQVNALHTLYRTAYATTFGERKLIDTFERVIVGELAHVLGKNVDGMIVELRSGHPVFSTNPPEGPISGPAAFATNSPPCPPDPEILEPKAPIALKDHTYLGKISSPSGKIVVGEATAPAKDTYVAEGKPGEWHAYMKEPSDADEGGLLLIHSDALGQQKKLRTTSAHPQESRLGSDSRRAFPPGHSKNIRCTRHQRDLLPQNHSCQLQNQCVGARLRYFRNMILSKHDNQLRQPTRRRSL